ncbi:MAG: hypothetical protein ACRCZD_01160 [Phycicoccus sp.]
MRGDSSFSRAAAARDFVDVHALAGRFGTQPLLDMAADVDPGLDLGVLADMFDTIVRYDDSSLALGQTLTRRLFAASSPAGPTT